MQGEAAMRIAADRLPAIRVLHIARYFDSMMESKVDLMAHEPDLAFFRVRPSNFHDPYGGRPLPAAPGASGALSIPLIGRPDDPHRTLYRTLTFALPGFRPHIIHAEEEPDSLTALQIVFARRLFAPRSRLILHTWQNVDRPKKFHVKAVIGATLRASDAVLCANRDGVGVLSAMGYKGVTKVITPQGVDTRVFSPLAGTERGGVFTLLYAGRFAPEKGLDTLFDAITRLGVPIRLILLGAGPEEEAIEKRIEALGSILSAEIIPPRPHVEMVRYLAKAHALVLPSKSTVVWQEQFGRVLVEAMACKCPVIGSDSGAIPEVVGSGGLIFREGDAEDLADCIRRLMGSAAERTRLAEAGYLRAVTVYSQERVALETAEFYREMARRGARN
jgi:glycosyltransferase involved in cell wall biosynthesis